MANNDRYLMVHGHFYQPPRENPWTGTIDPQYSASPWENWNRRIADECYIPMAQSRVHNSRRQIVDLHNNYTRISFDFGPTLLSWLADTHPDLMRRLREADIPDRAFPMAQAYNHIMLPLADARDRHTQIIWGMREFHFRFGFHPEGMWLPECGIDPETTRALIDHGVKHVILSPHQASKARPFGQAEWRDASMGGIDTRRCYRLFEIDGGGRTHFDRHLDVLFYTPGLNLKVSFDHLLNRPDDLARELENCYRPNYPGAQLVSIVTDGEIYGHHEKGGEEALTRLFLDIVPALGLRVCSAGEFIRDNPPSWEVKLWNGEDGNGSSWSCGHGMGRWSRDCGCSPPCPSEWNQKWRGPLRSAFDSLRDRVRQAARRELGGLVLDLDDALNDYISVILDPSPTSRAAFLRRHGQRRLDSSEVEKLWRILEALRNAMLMYTSCGWFFDELSGLEPVQNMRYALRAAELLQPYHDGDLALTLENELAGAKSNLPQYGDGGGVFRELVLPSRHSDRELAAALAVCLADGFPADSLSWKVVRRTETTNASDRWERDISWGAFVCLDERLDRFIKAAWLARTDDFENSGVIFHGFEESQGDPARAAGDCPLEPDSDFAWLHEIGSRIRQLKRQELLEKFAELGIAHHRLPAAVRGMLYRRFSGDRERELLEETARLGTRAVPFLSRARRYGARVPGSIVKIVAGAFEQEISQIVLTAIGEANFGAETAAAIERSLGSARELGLSPSLEIPSRAIRQTAIEMLDFLAFLAEPDRLGSLTPTLLSDGGEWLAPRSTTNRQLGHPSASDLALAMGKGLAELRRRLLANPDPGKSALSSLPLPEMLAFAGKFGLNGNPPALGIEFWNFLDEPLARLIASDPAGPMSDDAGERLRRVGAELGFAGDAVEKRILAATRRGMERRPD